MEEKVQPLAADSDSDKSESESDSDFEYVRHDVDELNRLIYEERHWSEIEFSEDDGEVSDIESDDDDSSDEKDEITFREKVRQLITIHNFRDVQTKALIDLLRIELGRVDIPKSVTTLKALGKSKIRIRKVFPGDYWHLGLIDSIKSMNYDFLNHESILEIDICIDGAPLVKSSKLALWPILGAFVNRRSVAPFIIGVYVGRGSPVSSNELLEDFVNEIIANRDSSVKEHTEIKMKYKENPLNIRIRCFTCDAPARAFISCTKYHTAFEGCPKCAQKGEKVEYTTVYKNFVGDLRNDANFKAKLWPNHHSGTSILEKIDIKMVSSFPLDPMHLLDLGLGKKILKLYAANKGKKFFSSKANLKSAELKFIEICAFLPSEFGCRGIRTFDEIPRFKAKEFRLFLLYVGIVFLKDFMKKEQYEFFLKLFIALRLLYMGGEKRFVVSELYLKHFVAEFGKMFYKKSLTYTIHCILHIVDDARRYGSLETISNYKFENFIGTMKRTVLKSTQVLQQISNNDKLKKYHVTPKFFDKMKLSTDRKDKFVVLKNRAIVEITSVVKDGEKYSGMEYKTKNNFFDDPVSSSKVLSIYQVPVAQKLEEISFSYDDIMFKFAAFPYQECYVMIPLIHTM
jgi:hypothetical protein